MEELIQSLVDLLHFEFPGSIPELERAEPLSKVGGFLVWSGFEGMEQIDRQRQLNRVLKERLTLNVLRQLTTILTLTTEESSLMSTE